MCGIAGFQGNFERDILPRMNSCIAHRGPDGLGNISFDAQGTRSGLTHRRLSIIDLSDAGRQPMTIHCDCCGLAGDVPDAERVWLVYNGELYNFRELRADLVREGHRFSSHTDSEVILHLYVKHGAAMLPLLSGIFALAIYDGRPRGGHGHEPGDLLIARDGLGVKPLYIADVPAGFLFASELKALLSSGAVSPTLDLAGIHYTLAYLWTPAPHTVLQDVRKVPPGHALVVRDGTALREWTFYDLPDDPERFDLPDEEIAELLRAQLKAAVDRQMVSDVPVGAFLSGGLDSSSVVAMMKQLNPSVRLRCYSIGFEGALDADGNPADLPYAQRVADHLGVDLTTIVIDSTAIDHLDRMLYHLDEPTADPAPINALLIAERARADGIPVLLSGAGGDDILTGYRRHYAIRMERYWKWLPHGVRAGLASTARGESRFANVSVGRSTMLRRAAKAFSYAHLEGDERIASYFWWSPERMRRSLYSPEMKAAVAGVATAGPLLDSLRGTSDRDPLERMLYLEVKHFLADHNLNYTDKAGMAAGVEIRVPLLDREFVEFCHRIPISSKQKGRVGKAIFKQAMEPYLPRDVIYRPKTGFGMPLRKWMHHDLRERLDDTTSAHAIQRRGIFDHRAVQKLVAQDRAGAVDATYTLFAIMCLELWCRIFIDDISTES